MDDARLGAALRAARLRRGWTQCQVAASAGVSDAAVSRVERGFVDEMALATVRRVAGALSVRLELLPRTAGADLDRLINARHAGLAEEVIRRLRAIGGWDVRPEVSFGIYGERGVIDLLAWHAGTRTLLVIELKTAVIDVGELLGTLDRKVRLAPRVAEPLGWHPSTVAVWLAIGESMTNRRRVAAHGSTFDAALPDEGRRLRRWLEKPAGELHALSFVTDRRQDRPRSGYATLLRAPTRRPSPSRTRVVLDRRAQSTATTPTDAGQPPKPLPRVGL